MSAGNAAVRNGNATANGRRAETLALQQRLKDLTPVHAGQFGRLLGQLLQRLLFVLRLQGREDSFAAL